MRSGESSSSLSKVVRNQQYQYNYLCYTSAMKYHIIFLIGFFLAILPFIGIPTTWKMIIVGLIGAVMMVISLIKYYSAYSAQELNQTFTDSDPDSRNGSDSVEEPKEETKIEVEKSQPSPFYDYRSDTKVHNRVQQSSIKVTKKKKIEAKEDDEYDLEDESYLKKNQYEEERVF